MISYGVEFGNTHILCVLILQLSKDFENCGWIASTAAEWHKVNNHSAGHLSGNIDVPSYPPKQINGSAVRDQQSQFDFRSRDKLLVTIEGQPALAYTE
jgi:hypothetical protein